jgi:HPt (histidine-containing phosphotransfer) domain-containing protein
LREDEFSTRVSRDLLAQAQVLPLRTPMMESSIPMIDTRTLQALRELGGEHDLVRELIDLFLEDAPVRLQSMQAAVSGPDFATLELQAHTLKSSSANLGAEELSRLCARLELAARHADANACEQIVPRVREVYEENARELREVR